MSVAIVVSLSFRELCNLKGLGDCDSCKSLRNTWCWVDLIEINARDSADSRLSDYEWKARSFTRGGMVNS